MRRNSKSSGCDRERLCLLASNTLPGSEAVSVENHLATCTSCREYFDDVKRAMTPLANWENTFLHVKPSQTAQSRWAEDFQAAINPVRSIPFSLLTSILAWSHDIIAPHRRVWAGFAAVWIGVLTINFSLREPVQSQAMKASRPSLEMVRAYLAGERFIAEWDKSDKSRVAEPTQHPLPPTRSERRSQMIQG